MSTILKYTVLSVVIITGIYQHNTVNKKIKAVKTQNAKYGIAGLQAPELSKEIEWVDGMGTEIEPIQLKEYDNTLRVIYGFQSWCPGCHSRGLPALQKMTAALEENYHVKFFAIQTVFEGESSNTKERMLEVQEKYKLNIPFGHDIGNSTTRNRSSTMYDYRTGGTPWFIIIDKNNTVIFNDYHLDVDKTIEFLKEHS